MIGSSVGAYRIVEKIRDGGAGTVFKAQGSKGEIVAIKMISEAWNEQRDRRKAFKREAEITQKLVHPGVIRVFGYSEGPPRPYIVLEYFPSENLKFTLWHKQQVLEGRRMPILKQCADALYYVHTQGVVHRDVKPENFLVNAEGSVRLIDFSIAQTKWDRFLFSFGKKVDGTPLYMAPEQIRNETLDQRADMYSFGVMVFELMTRRPPFIGASVDSILEKHLRAAPPSMRSIVQDVTLELDELVTKLLSKKAADRPADMSFVITVLNRLAKKEEDVWARERGPSRVVTAIGQAGTGVPATRAVGSRPTPGAVPAIPGGARPTPGAVPAVGSTAGTKPPSSTRLEAAKVAGAEAAAPASGPGAPASTRTPTKVRVAAAPPATGAQGTDGVPPAQPVTRTQTKSGVPSAQPVTRTQTKSGVPSAQPVTRTQTKSGVPSAQPTTKTQTKARPAPSTGAQPADAPPTPPDAASAASPPATTEAASAPPPVTPAPEPPQPPTPEPPPPAAPEAAAPAPAVSPAAASPAAGPEAAPAAKEASEPVPKPAAEGDPPKAEPAPEPPKGKE